MYIRDERKINQPFLSQTIIDEFKKYNIVFKFNQKYNWYDIHLIKQWCYNSLSYYERLGTVFGNNDKYSSLYPFYFRIHSQHDLVTQTASKIPELSKITFLLKDN